MPRRERERLLSAILGAILKPDSNSGRILDLVREDRIRLVVSPPIIAEMARVLRYPRLRALHGLDDAELDVFLSDLEAFPRSPLGRAQVRRHSRRRGTPEKLRPALKARERLREISRMKCFAGRPCLEEIFPQAAGLPKRERDTLILQIIRAHIDHGCTPPISPGGSTCFTQQSAGS